MTATNAPAVSRPRPAPRHPALVTARLLRLELRHNAMLWMLPVVFALFWLTTYRKTMAMPPLWNMRAVSLQSGAILDFITPVVGAAAWMGSREARRHTAELMSITARPRWARLLADVGRHDLLGTSGVPGLPGRPVRDDRAPGQLGRPAVVAGRGRGREPAGLLGAGIRRRGAAAQPVHGTAGRHRGVLRARAQHGAHRRQPVVLADLAGGRRPLGHRIEREHGDLLPLRS